MVGFCEPGATHRFLYLRLEKGWRVGVGKAGLKSKWRSQHLMSPRGKASRSPAPKGPEAGTEARMCSGKGQSQRNEWRRSHSAERPWAAAHSRFRLWLGAHTCKGTYSHARSSWDVLGVPRGRELRQVIKIWSCCLQTHSYPHMISPVGMSLFQTGRKSA